MQAAKLGYSSTGPRASALLKYTGPTLSLLVQIIYTHMKTYTLPNIFITWLQIRDLKLLVQQGQFVSLSNILLNFLLSTHHWPIGPVGKKSPIALHQIYWLGASGQRLFSQTVNVSFNIHVL